MADTFCVLPWMHLATHPHGGVSLCCVSDFTDGINCASNTNANGDRDWLNLNLNSIDEIMNADSFRDVRLKMLEGRAPKPCLRCYREEARGIKSKRKAENANYPSFTFEDARAGTDVEGRITPKLKFVELRLGNICNVKCRSCNPASSSKWIQDYKKLEQQFRWVRSYAGLEGFDWPEKDHFWEDLLAHSDDLEVIYINGGEPTLIKKHWAFLDDLKARGKAKDIVLWYNINMTNLPEMAFEAWRGFKEIRISCSIDDLGPRNALLRHGTRWESVVENLDRLQSEKWINVSVNQTISWLNLWSLPEFYQEMKHRRNLWVHLNYVYDPDYLAPWILPEPAKLACLERMNGVLADFDYRAIESQLLNNDSNPDLLQQGIEYHRAIDKMRRESVEEIFPEIFDLLK